MAVRSFSQLRRQDSGDYWPGFVDALATLLLVAIFLLSAFLVAQFVLGQELTGRDEQLAQLDQQNQSLRTQLDALADALGVEQSNALNEVNALLTENTQLEDENESLTEEGRRLRATLVAAESEASRLRQSLAAAQGQATLLTVSLDDERALSEAAQLEAALLRQEIAALNDQLSVLLSALEESEQRDREQQAQIENLSQRLNTALARRAQELARVRSEFFEKLTNALGERSDVRIVGDRFVFETDVVFASAEADITPAGRDQLARIADVIKEIAEDIPDDVDWIIRVDGHTDERGISTEQFPSNWYLSAARAISVVNFFEEQGIESRRLVAAGFGEFYPLDEARTQEAYTRNRRIELKLDSR